MADDRKPVEQITHDGETRANIPPAEVEPTLHADDRAPIRVEYERRNRDLDPQLIWRGKSLDQAVLEVNAPPVYLQEQIHPKALIEDLRHGRGGNGLFDYFGVTEDDREAEVEFYRHSKRWTNRMILGDALQVMTSLAEREGLKGQVQAIYIDPPYGIRFNSNFQWSTTSRDVKDGKLDHLTREPEQVKAFRDTWRDGIHSYLGYLRDRLVVARELLTDSGSCFVQIGDENVHRVRAVMDEVFGEQNFANQISFTKTSGSTADFLGGSLDFILWFAKSKDRLKFHQPLQFKRAGGEGSSGYTYRLEDDFSVTSLSLDDLPHEDPSRIVTRDNLTSQSQGRDKGEGAASWFKVCWEGAAFDPSLKARWKTNEVGMARLEKSRRVTPAGRTLRYLRKLYDFPVFPFSNLWFDTSVAGFAADKRYVVETSPKVIQRCLLMTTDPGDLVLDPTCGSGTTAYVAEQWGRRWITIDTSRVALALARARIMGAKYPYYLLADSSEGVKKEAEVSRTPPATHDTLGDIRHGFVYERVPHITLKSIANNTEIDTIWDQMHPAVEDARAHLNAALAGHPDPFEVQTGGRKGQKIDFTATDEVEMPSGEMAPANGFMEWEIPREAPEGWPEAAVVALDTFWQARIARQGEIDASIAARAEYEFLYDKPYEDRKRVRVAGPFTVESLSPHRVAAVNEHGELIDEIEAAEGGRSRDSVEAGNYQDAMLENLTKSGVHQQGREDRITFTSLKGWPGEWICAEGRYMEGEQERRAGVFIGPEYGTVQRADLVACAREAADAGFDLVIACAFNFDAHAGEFRKLGRVPILHARMNPDLHMAGELKAGGGNLFVVFGEPDAEVIEDGEKFCVKINGVDVFKPQTGEVISTEPEDIACWFVDTDYSGESFFVRQAYFPGADIPYKAIRTTLKANIDEDAWESLKRTVSRPFARPSSGRIAVKVINHLGDEVMKVFSVVR